MLSAAAPFIFSAGRTLVLPPERPELRWDRTRTSTGGVTYRRNSAVTNAGLLEGGRWLSGSARSWKQLNGGLRYSDECHRDKTFDLRHTQR